MAYRSALLVILVLGCGSKEPAKSASNVETEVPKTETPAEPAPAATPKPAAAAVKPAAPAAAPSGPASADDLRELLQAVIDDDALTPYLHLEQRNRFPLHVSGHGVPKDLQLTKMTKPVVIDDEGARDSKKAVLVITEIDVKGAEATVRYRYDIEGVRGTATLNKPYGHWAVKNSHVAEH
jgi:hypothetical protein